MMMVPTVETVACHSVNQAISQVDRRVSVLVIASPVTASASSVRKGQRKKTPSPMIGMIASEKISHLGCREGD